MLLNFHTHQLEEPEDTRRIYNLMVPNTEEALEIFPETLPAGRFSVGIHPNFIQESLLKKQLEAAKVLSKNEAVAMIGECGLDRTAAVVLAVQESVFIQQIRIAEAANKPVVVHCVRCFNELISIKKVVRPKVPIVIHGFNNKPEIARLLIERGFYFSLGAALLHPDSNASKVISEIPRDKLFLENDDKDLSINKIYEATAVKLNLSIENLSQQILNNWMELTV